MARHAPESGIVALAFTYRTGSHPPGVRRMVVVLRSMSNEKKMAAFKSKVTIIREEEG